MLTKEIKRALVVEREELAKKKIVLAEEIAALEVKIRSIDGVVGLTVAEGKAKELGEAHRIQGPLIEILRAHPFGMTPSDITKELFKQGLEESPTRKMIASVWQVLYRLKKTKRIKVKTGGVHVWIGGAPYSRPLKPGGVRERIMVALQEVAPAGLTAFELKEKLETDGVVLAGKTDLSHMINTVLNQMRKKDDVRLRASRWDWIGGAVSRAGGWNKMSADERSVEMKRRRAGNAVVPVEPAHTNGNGNGNGTGKPALKTGLREKIHEVMAQSPGITRSALRGVIEPLFKQVGKTPIRELLWVELAQRKRTGKIIERNGKLYLAENAPAPAPPPLSSAGAGMVVHGMRALMKTHPSGITRLTLIQKLEAQGFKATGKQPFSKRVRNEVSRMKEKKEVREALGLLFLTGKLPAGIRLPKPAAEEAAQA